MDNYENNKNLSIGDKLAIERTRLAYERTFLAYMRTVISFIVASLTIFKLIGGVEGLIVVIILLTSAAYFYKRARKIQKAYMKRVD